LEKLALWRAMSDGRCMNVCIMGLGEIGLGLVRALGEQSHLRLVAVVDSAPDKRGRALTEWVESAPALPVLAELPKLEGDAVLLHAAGSFLAEVIPSLMHAVRLGYHVVSTCEELADPGGAAAELNALCEREGRVVVATGVNPGFVFERFAALLAHASGPITAVHGVRVVDTRTRRQALQKKTGAGLSRAEFAAAVATGRFGHVGLQASARLAARGCGLVLDGLSETIEPVMHGETVAGIHQVVVGSQGASERVRLDLTMALGAEQPRDEIWLAPDGLRVLIPGGTPGERATFWTTLRAAAWVSAMKPGVRNVLDVPLGVR
jgi:4-hydroxy-tetrahydrodipicolinate reductase